MPLEVLNKVEQLTDNDWRFIAAHPWLGLLTLFQLRGQQELPYRAMTVAYEHHMKCDLTGYPKNVRPRTLSIFSKIVAVADGFDAATSRRVVPDRCRCRRPRCSPEMRDNPRRGFDSVVVKAFINLLGIYPVGTLVVLDTFELGDRALGESEPRGRVATDRAHRQRRARQRRVPGAQRRSGRAERGRRVSSARSSRPRIPTVMASTSATTSSDALTQRFARAARAGRRALVCYVTAGHPDPARSVALLRGIEAAGADVIELGVPFSDPMADGPIIQASSQHALEHGHDARAARSI